MELIHGSVKPGEVQGRPLQIVITLEEANDSSIENDDSSIENDDSSIETDDSSIENDDSSVENDDFCVGEPVGTVMPWPRQTCASIVRRCRRWRGASGPPSPGAA